MKKVLTLINHPFNIESMSYRNSGTLIKNDSAVTAVVVDMRLSSSFNHLVLVLVIIVLLIGQGAGVY